MVLLLATTLPRFISNAEKFYSNPFMPRKYLLSTIQSLRFHRVCTTLLVTPTFERSQHRVVLPSFCLCGAFCQFQSAVHCQWVSIIQKAVIACIKVGDQH